VRRKPRLRARCNRSAVQAEGIQEDVIIPAGYAIVPARSEHLATLPTIELAAARLLEGHAPESALLETTSLTTFRQAADAGRLWVALHVGVPVGFALVEMLARDLPHLDEIDVTPAHGRRGIGTALVRSVCRWAAGEGFEALTLTTFRAVRWNMPFYARLGYSEVPARSLRRELSAVVANESARGLAPDRRLVMRYDCSPGVRRASAEDRAALFDIWWRSARQTHLFVSEADFESFRPLVRKYLNSPSTQFWVLETARGTRMGFMGLAGGEIESLFLAPEFHGRGGGRRLVAHARMLCGGLTVSVNEQNEAAVQFYERCGFAIEGRSECDDDGRPYPLLRMRLAGA
jgi:putative acetyltransferase